MKAFKFRGADQIPFALDILLTGRLYCADWRVLNDPMEGSFAYSYPTLSARTRNPIDTDRFDEVADLIVDEKQKKKVCSLSLTAATPLLWAHYASGFTGLALEVDLPDDDPRIHRVTYSKGCELDLAIGTDAEPLATQVLSNKFLEWAYEQEVRIIQNDTWYSLPKPILRVICGPRMNEAMFEALRIVCRDKTIPICRMHIDHDGLDITGSRSPAQRLSQAWRARNNRDQ